MQKKLLSFILAVAPFAAFAAPIVYNAPTNVSLIASSTEVLPVVTPNAACSVTGTKNTGISADYKSVYTCYSGIWKQIEGVGWGAAVASYALLPASDPAGTVRTVTNIGKAFMWNGASWIPLAADQNGNLNITGAMSANSISATTSITAGGAMSAASASTTGNMTAGGSMAATGNISAVGNIGAAGQIAAAGRITSNEYVQINGIATVGAGCAPTGLFGRDAGGELISCQSGTWKKASVAIPTAVNGMPCPTTNIFGITADGQAAFCVYHTFLKTRYWIIYDANYYDGNNSGG